MMRKHRSRDVETEPKRRRGNLGCLISFAPVAVLVLALLLPHTGPRCATAADSGTGERARARSFVEISGTLAIVHCGTFDLYLDAARGFSMAASPRDAGGATPPLRSTRLRLWLDDQEQTLANRAHITHLGLLEEGPQRIVLRAPFTLADAGGQLLATAQYDLTCYPEGDVFVTLRILPRDGVPLRAAVELAFAFEGAPRFERAHDLPLVSGTSPAGGALGVYWHNGEAADLGAVGGEMYCRLSCLAEAVSGTPWISRSFVISLAPTRAELRSRCLAHIQPLRPEFMDGCQPMIEQTPESREIAREVRGWCYSFRDGTYNFHTLGARAAVEFFNPNDEPRRIRLRFVTRGQAALDVAGAMPASRPDLQPVLLTAGRTPPQSAPVSATLAAFNLSARDCLTIEAKPTSGMVIQWAGAKIGQTGVSRFYGLVTGNPPASLAEVRVSGESPQAVAEIRSLTAPPGQTQPAVESLSALPAPSRVWGRFSRLREVAVLRNRPDRAVMQIQSTNEGNTLSCRTYLVFRGEPNVLALHGYHTLEALEAASGLRATTLDLPRFTLSGKDAGERPGQFFYADRRKRLRIAPAATTNGFGYNLRSLDGFSHPDFAFCGFAGTTPWLLGFLGRPILGEGNLVADSASPSLSMQLQIPAVVERGQEIHSMWTLVLATAGVCDLALSQSALLDLKADPVDLDWAIDHFAPGDGRVTHRVYELSPGGNPASEDGRCYLLDGGRELAAIGAGCDAARWPWMFRIRALGLDPARLTKILLTHAAPNGAGGAAALKRLTGAAIHCHESALEALSVAGPERDQRLTLPGDASAGFFEPTGIDQPLGDEALIAVGDLKVRYLHTPGPRGENGVYLVEVGGRQAAFTGDLLDAGEEPGVLPGGPADAHRHGNLPQWIASLERLRGEHPDLVLRDRRPPLAGIREIENLCNRAIERCRRVLELDNVDYLLPRPIVMQHAPERSPPEDDDGLWAAKELDRFVVWRRTPPEIAPGLWRVGGGFAGEYEDGNVYLVDGGGEMALIGAGSGLHTGAIVGRILSLGKNPLDVRYILLPSSHWYEARGAGSLRAATMARVCAHRYEAGALGRGDSVQTGLRVGGHHFAAFPPCRVDRDLRWGETLRVGRRRILVLDAPGFHRGSTAFLMVIGGKRYLATGQAACGDLSIPNGGFLVGTTGWLDPHWGGCEATWQRTLERMLALGPDVLLPSQGPPEKGEVLRQIRECMERLERLRKTDGARVIFPAAMFEPLVEPRRPDISRLTQRP